jgi:polysaccharide export outer membrane protein
MYDGMRGFAWVWTGLLVLPLVACQNRAPSPHPVDPDPEARTAYKIGVTDVLRITVWKNDELGVQVPVRMDGKISVPLVDDVQAEGLEAMELKEVLTRELSEYITAPDVSVIVVEMNSHAVNVIGSVLEAIAIVGGFAPFADKSDIRIVRRMGDGSEQEYVFDYSAYTKGRAPGTNIVLQNGDTIIVSE